MFNAITETGLMKHTYYSSLFSMYAQVAGANKQKNISIKPVFDRLGIKFDVISAGKLYPGEFSKKELYGLRQKDIASHP